MIAFIVDHWRIYGHGFYVRYSGYPEDFLRLVRTEVPRHARDCLTFARIALELDECSLALKIIQEGLARCPDRATALRANLKREAKKAEQPHATDG